MEQERLPLFMKLPVRALNAGFFRSRGIGKHPERRIDSHEVIVVTSGVLGIYEEDKEFEVHAGQALLLRPQRRHGGTAPYLPDLTFYWIHFQMDESARQTADETVQLPQWTTLIDPDAVIELFRRYLDLQEMERCNPHLCSLLMLEILCELADSDIARDRSPDLGNALASRADSLLRTHFHEQVSTTSIARQLDCNPDYLGRVYHRRFARTITDALHEYRLKYACQQLLNGSGNINEIAIQSGFADAAYFRRIFKRSKGVSPSHYKKRYALVHVNTE